MSRPKPRAPKTEAPKEEAAKEEKVPTPEATPDVEMENAEGKIEEVVDDVPAVTAVDDV
jgi:hypothetical protein